MRAIANFLAYRSSPINWPLESRDFLNLATSAYGSVSMDGTQLSLLHASHHMASVITQSWGELVVPSTIKIVLGSRSQTRQVCRRTTHI